MPPEIVLPNMPAEASLNFRTHLREARETSLLDSEAFASIIHVIEQLGCFLSGKTSSLGHLYKGYVLAMARESALADNLPSIYSHLHIPIGVLYDRVTLARNDALHQGAIARHLTVNCVLLALVLEDALLEHVLKGKAAMISDYMIRNPICAEPWQPISFVRQQLLVNSFSYLPVNLTDGKWYLISDLAVARYLNSPEEPRRNEKLASQLASVLDKMQLDVASTCSDTDLLATVLGKFDGRPVLVCRNGNPDELVGIVTAFDLL